MEFAGLTRDDLDNVRALNLAWLRSGPGGTAGLSARGVERLASAPFLLFTLCEDDDARWQRLLDAPPQRDLLRDAGSPRDELHSLQAAGLAFLWELARRNPYAARLVSHASSGWCRLIAHVPLMQLLDFSADHDLITARFDPDSAVYRRLLRRSESAVRELREAAQLAALHALLTAPPAARPERLRAAACRSRPPVRELTDEV